MTCKLLNPRAVQQCALRADPSTPMPNATYTDLLDRAEQLEVLNSELGSIRNITSCRFVDTAFERIVESECPGLKVDSERLATAALISAITLTITSFYFCICIQCDTTALLVAGPLPCTAAPPACSLFRDTSTASITRRCYRLQHRSEASASGTLSLTPKHGQLLPLTLKQDAAMTQMERQTVPYCTNRVQYWREQTQYVGAMLEA